VSDEEVRRYERASTLDRKNAQWRLKLLRTEMTEVLAARQLIADLRQMQ
jgi:hypothetical protein